LRIIVCSVLIAAAVALACALITAPNLHSIAAAQTPNTEPSGGASSVVDTGNWVHVGGAIPKASDWTAGQLKAQFAAEIKPITYAGKGESHTCNCVPLLSLLKAAGVQTELKMDPAADPKTKNRPLRLAVVVRGRDGYAALFSLAELLPAIGNRSAWLALDIDGGELPARDGPVKLIVPQDSKPGRWVHEIATITILDAPAATQP
jgi:hypothetical protein